MSVDLQKKLEILAKVETDGIGDVYGDDLSEFFSTLDEAGVSHGITEFNENDAKNDFYMMLDDFHEEVEIAGLTFQPSEVFKNTASESDQNHQLYDYIGGQFYGDDDRYFLINQVDEFIDNEFENSIEEIKQYVIDQEGYEENSSQARAIESANDFTDLLARYQITQESNELRSAISEVQGETQSPGLADIGVQRNTERQSKVRKM